MIKDDSNQQELQPWQSEQAKSSGVETDSHAKPRNSNPSSIHPNDSNCTKCRKKCGPIGWWFSPITDKLGYSLITAFYHAFNFFLTLGIFIFMCVGLSVSLGLLVIVVGFPLLWFVCEISVVMARFDLAMAYYMVEDDKRLVQHRIHKLQLSLYKKLAPCPCNGGNSLWARIKSFFSCEMLLIIIYQLIFKPIITSLTCWMCIADFIFVANLFVPIVYLIHSDVFTKHWWCPYGGNSCNSNGDCRCYGWGVNNFGDALLVCLVTLLILPFIFRVSQWFAKGSKLVTYYFLTRFYHDGVYDRDHENLLSKSSKLSNSNNQTSALNSSNNPAIVHSVNNPYVNDV